MLLNKHVLNGPLSNKASSNGCHMALTPLRKINGSSTKSSYSTNCEIGSLLFDPYKRKQNALHIKLTKRSAFVKTGKGRVIQKIKSGSTTICGFKKRLFNQVTARGYMLYPMFNRRKHNHSYCLVVNNQHVKFSKAFSYLSKNKIAFFIGTALAEGNQLLVSKKSKAIRKRPIPSLASVVETETALLLQRCQHYFTLRESRQSINHSWWRPRTQRCVRFGGRLWNLSPQSSLALKRSRWVDHGSAFHTL